MRRNRFIKKGVSVVIFLLVITMTLHTTAALPSLSMRFFPVVARPTTLYVGGAGPENYTTIQDAIDNASAGDLVFVYSGLYTGKIQISISLSLQGESIGSTVIDGCKLGDVITILASSVVIQGFTISNGTNDIQHAGIKISNGNNIKISGNTICENEGVGIIVHGSDTASIDIQGNTIVNNTYGVYLTDSSTVNISDNIISNNEVGLYSVGVSDCHINANTMENRGLGLHIERSSRILISENIITGNRNGIYLFNSSESILTANMVQENQWYGIWLKDSSENIIEKNSILNNVDLGLYLDTSYDNTIRNNTLLENDNGIYFKDSAGNIIQNNYLRNDKFNACFVSHTLVHRRNIWRSNYWERPRLLPYPIFGTIKLQNKSYPGIIFDWTPLRQHIEYPLHHLNIEDTILYVGGSGPNNYSSIQTAIDDANNNDTVYVYHGIYHGRISIPKPLRLIGENKTTTILDGEGINDIITVTTDYVTIHGFTIQNAHFDILVNHSAYVEISGNNIINGLHAISVQDGCRFLTITNNSFYDNVYGVRLFFSSDVTVSFNNFHSYKMNAFFYGTKFSQARHHWYKNYWGGSRYLPYFIFGKIRFGNFSLVWLNYDFFPLDSPCQFKPDN
ncbi:MAG: right-handed parallel beta-helix repeat-containing protein [Candidatus Thermoplasmatota archaeon]|nr:right-handed parallel beta-helix repeat-containing protein [Candidatus Thermoplasmatota archaeon]